MLAVYHWLTKSIGLEQSSKLDFDRLENTHYINLTSFKSITRLRRTRAGHILVRRYPISENVCTYRPGGPHCCENWHIPSYFEFAVVFRGVNLQSENYKPFFFRVFKLSLKELNHEFRLFQKQI